MTVLAETPRTRLRTVCRMCFGSNLSHDFSCLDCGCEQVMHTTAPERR